VISSDSFGPSTGGTVAVTARILELRRGGAISSDTHGEGAAGAVTVQAERLLVDGAGLQRATGVFSRAIAGSTGTAGTVAVTAGELELRRGGAISSTTFGPGNAGEVTVDARRLLITGAGSDRFTGITSRTSAAERDGRRIVATGSAGRVAVRAGELELSRGGKISSSTTGPGAAGQVSVVADHMVVLSAGKVETNSDAGGRAGNVSVRASHLVVRDGGLIGSSGAGAGPAGNVHLSTDMLEVEHASIRTEGSVSEGGHIEVAASDLISLRAAEVTSSGIEPEAGRSVITLRAPLKVLNASRVTSLTGAGEPLAGSGLAQLFGGTTVISTDSFVAASSSLTVSGLENEVGSRLVVPQGVFLDAGNLMQESCAAHGMAGLSSFTGTGRGGLPPDPAQPLPGPYVEPRGVAAADQAGPGHGASFGEVCRAMQGE
jgi:large exoprotein involved in heme utilization and adhesion